MNLFWNYLDSRAEQKDAKKHGNVIHPPIVNDDQDDETHVIQILPPTELHLLMRPVNTMYKGLESIWSESETWLKACNVKKPEYHGGRFAGNESRRFLKNVDRLENIAPNEMVNVYKCFNNVVTACCGDNLSPNYVVAIRKFGEAHTKLKLSVTPKIHAVIYHIPKFCSSNGRGLATWVVCTSRLL